MGSFRKWLDQKTLLEMARAKDPGFVEFWGLNKDGEREGGVVFQTVSLEDILRQYPSGATVEDIIRNMDTPTDELDDDLRARAKLAGSQQEPRGPRTGEGVDKRRAWEIYQEMSPEAKADLRNKINDNLQDLLRHGVAIAQRDPDREFSDPTLFSLDSDKDQDISAWFPKARAEYASGRLTRADLESKLENLLEKKPPVDTLIRGIIDRQRIDQNPEFVWTATKSSISHYTTNDAAKILFNTLIDLGTAGLLSLIQDEVTSLVRGNGGLSDELLKLLEDPTNHFVKRGGWKKAHDFGLRRVKKMLGI